jgi:hypothetical protein
MPQRRRLIALITSRQRAKVATFIILHVCFVTSRKSQPWQFKSSKVVLLFEVMLAKMKATLNTSKQELAASGIVTVAESLCVECCILW